MARPTRTNAEYFYHPASFRNDRRVKAIRARHGACGYGLLMMLIELLTDADNTALATDEMELELLAGDLNSEADEVLALILSAEKVGLFSRNEAGLLKCPQLDEWLAPVFEKRNRNRNTATALKLSQPATETPITVTETAPVENSIEQESIEQESIEQESIEQESKDVLSPVSLRSTAPAREKKVDLLSEIPIAGPENPQPQASHAEAPADVPTRKARAPRQRPTVFADSPYADLAAFTAALAGTDYEHADLAYYHQYIGNWATSKGAKYTDWLSMMRNWMLRDADKGELRTRSTSQQPGNYEYPTQHRAQNGVAGHGFPRPASVHANPFGIASPVSLAIAGALAGGSDGDYPGFI